jgi:hypothetical protein
VGDVGREAQRLDAAAKSAIVEGAVAGKDAALRVFRHMQVGGGGAGRRQIVTVAAF